MFLGWFVSNNLKKHLEIIEQQLADIENSYQMFSNLTELQESFYDLPSQLKPYFADCKNRISEIKNINVLITYHFEQLIDETNSFKIFFEFFIKQYSSPLQDKILDDIFENYQTNLIFETNENIYNCDNLLEKISTLCDTIYNEKKEQLVDKNIKITIESSLSTILKLKESTNFYLKDLNTLTHTTLESVRDLLDKGTKNLDELLSRFNEERDLIVKEFKYQLSNILEKHENQSKSIKLDQDEIVRNNTSLNENINKIISNLNNLNERIHNIEEDLAKIINTESIKIKTNLNESKTNLMKFSDSIKKEAVKNLNEIDNEANQKLAEISIIANTKLDSLNTAHTDFINLVSNAGIYKLTENYDKKAIEEKKQYETYRTYTGRAIGAAIVFTIAILTIPLIEYWGANPPVDTNYYTILARLTISLMFFVLALYFSKQASKHYECYQENHRTFLQLAALEPFMARMTPEEQQEIRKSLVPSYFNQGADGKFATKGDDVDMSMMFTFMDKLSNFAQNKKDTKTGESTVAESKPQG